MSWTISRHDPVAKPQGLPHYLRDRGELWIAFEEHRFVQAFAVQAGVACGWDMPHAPATTSEAVGGRAAS